MMPKLEFCLLGPVAVRCDGVSVPVPRGRQRAVLAVLLLNAGRVVSVGEIAETLWGHAPLPSAPATIRNYVKRLRRVRPRPPGDHRPGPAAGSDAPACVLDLPPPQSPDARPTARGQA